VAPEVRGTLATTLPIALIQAASIAVTTALLFVAQSNAAELQRWTAKQPPPHFTLPDTDGRTIALDSRRGSITIVHFFATWCEPCREELPALDRLSERSGSEIKVLAISVAEPDGRVRRFLQSMPLSIPVLLDRDRVTARSWHVSTLPTSIVLDAGLKPKLLIETDYAWDTIDPRTLTEEISIVIPAQKFDAIQETIGPYLGGVRHEVRSTHSS